VAQVVKWLSSKGESLSSNPRAIQKKEKKRKEKEKESDLKAGTQTGLCTPTVKGAPIHNGLKVEAICCGLDKVGPASVPVWEAGS
jgi:hypothetical protein